MPGYQHPCRYCDKLVERDANFCPYCGRINPLTARCPRCRNPVKKAWKQCDHCGLSLEVLCPHCMRDTRFDDYCAQCGARLVVVCPNPKCKSEQPPLGDLCIRCGRPLNP